MTGASFCRQLLAYERLVAAVVCGATNAFMPDERVVMLERAVYDASTVKAWTIAAHEVAHAVQANRWGRLVIGLRVLMPMRLWLEWDANARARRMMTLSGLVADEGVLRANWESYVWPAVRQVLAVAAVMMGAVAWQMTE